MAIPKRLFVVTALVLISLIIGGVIMVADSRVGGTTILEVVRLLSSVIFSVLALGIAFFYPYHLRVRRLENQIRNFRRQAEHDQKAIHQVHSELEKLQNTMQAKRGPEMIETISTPTSQSKTILSETVSSFKMTELHELVQKVQSHEERLDKLEQTRVTSLQSKQMEPKTPGPAPQPYSQTQSEQKSIESFEIVAQADPNDYSEGTLNKKDRGAFLIKRCSQSGKLLAVPNRDRLDSMHQYYSIYKDFYLCAEPKGGFFIIIVRPAIVKPGMGKDEWKLTEQGEFYFDK